MDASLLQVIAGLRRYDPARHRKPSRSELLDMVRILDMANIVTGFFEAGRDFSLFMLMDQVQNLLRDIRPAKAMAPRLAVSEDRPRKRVKTNTYRESHAYQQVLLPDVKPIKRFRPEDAPDMAELPDHTEPFIVTGGIDHWPAIADPAKRWKDVEYLLRVAGEGRIVPVEIGSSYTAEGWTQRMMDFTEFLVQTGWMAEHSHNDQASDDTAEEPTLYLAQHDLFQQFPELLQDIIKPDYVFAHPEAPEHFPEYKPPSAGYTLNAWLGPAGTYSPAHTDPYYNCYGRRTYKACQTTLLTTHVAQVVGKKHIWVASPICTHYMAGQDVGFESGDEDDVHGNAASQQYMGNTAQIDVFAASPGKAISKRDQAFQQQVLPYARQAILEEGDLLFMPPKYVALSLF
jgi:lysine-specific demethylase 8